MIGGAVASAARANSSVAYCERRFRSYNPATGTYLGYDGLRHRCS
ncbi:BA14K family protein [Lichenibacterium dinghuense]|nr:BA14K family protein [Lichenibacterium sp. 6Y81]